MQLEFCTNSETVKSFNNVTQTNEAPALPAKGGSLARGSVRASMCSCLSTPPVFMTTVEVRIGEGFSHKQQLNSSGFVSVRVEEIRVFQARNCGQ